MRLRPGTRVGPFELQAWAWRGPGVAAWHASSPEEGQVLLQIAVGEPHGVERLQRTAKVLAGFAHPGAARLVREALDVDPPHLVLSAPRQPALRGPLPAERALDAAAGVAAVLSAAHAAAIWGPELHVATILGPPEAPTLTDWGAAWRAGMNPGAEPERSVARDVAGVGQLLYALLTGLPPGPDELDPGEGFAEPVRALVRELTGPPAQRPSTAREVAFTLRQLRADPGASVGRPPERFVGPGRMLRRPRPAPPSPPPLARGRAAGIAVAVLVAGVVSILGAALALLLMGRPTGPRTGTDPERATAQRPLDAKLRVYRIRGQGPERMQTGTVAREGDLVQLGISSDRATHGAVVSIDGGGAVTLHFPSDVKGSTALAPGEAPISEPFALGEAPDYERFFLVTDDEPVRVDRVLAAAEALASRGDARTEPLHVPGLAQTSFVVRKESRR